VEYRTLGGTGLKVSTHCLGTMMFGEWGNTDVEDCIGTIRAAIDGGINFVDTADVYSAGESEEIVGKALKGRRDEVILATKVHGQMGPGRNDEGNSRVWIMKEIENSLRPRHGSHRPVSDPPSRRGHGRRGDARHAHGSATPGQDPLFRLVHLPRVADGRGAVDGGAA